VRRGQVATVLAYSMTFLLLIGTIIATVFIQAASSGSATNNTAMMLPLIFNPLAALASTLTGIVPSSIQVIGGSSSAPGSGIALWQANLMADAVLVLVFLFLATKLLRPGKSKIFRLRRQAIPPAEVIT